jgi:hypothetical protein
MVNKNHLKKKTVEINPNPLPLVEKPPELLEHDYTYYLNSSQDTTNSHHHTTPSKDKFARLKYGNNNELIFNLNCQIKYLVEFFYSKLKQTVHVESSKQDLDVTDVDGTLKYLKGNHFRLGSEFLNPRELYILVDSKQCDQNGVLLTTSSPIPPPPNNNNNYFRITPLLINNSDLLTQTYLNTLNARSFKSTKKYVSSNPSFSSSNFSSTSNKANKNMIQNNLTLIREFDETTTSTDAYASSKNNGQISNNNKKTSRHS